MVVSCSPYFSFLTLSDFTLRMEYVVRKASASYIQVRLRLYTLACATDGICFGIIPSHGYSLSAVRLSQSRRICLPRTDGAICKRHLIDSKRQVRRNSIGVGLRTFSVSNGVYHRHGLSQRLGSGSRRTLPG